MPLLVCPFAQGYYRFSLSSTELLDLGCFQTCWLLFMASLLYLAVLRLPHLLALTGVTYRRSRRYLQLWIHSSSHIGAPGVGFNVLVRASLRTFTFLQLPVGVTWASYLVLMPLSLEGYRCHQPRVGERVHLNHRLGCFWVVTQSTSQEHQ